MPIDDYAPISPYTTGLMARCPRCGEGRLFKGFLTLAPSCSRCGLPFDFADSGDGPAFFVSFAAGLLVVGVALVVDVLYEPPIWVHLVISLPLVLVLCLGLLRPLKGLLIALQYRNKAEQGRMES
jgi:uncharacterized protein (DUF983 family)